MTPNTSQSKLSHLQRYPQQERQNQTQMSFPRALNYLYSTWENFEAEQASWRIERVKLKAEITSLSKQNKQTQQLYQSAQKCIALLENSLKSSRKELQDQKAKQQEQQVNSDDNAPNNKQIQDLSDIDNIIETTKQMHGHSKDVLSRRLDEIQKILGEADASLVSKSHKSQSSDESSAGDDSNSEATKETTHRHNGRRSTDALTNIDQKNDPISKPKKLDKRDIGPAKTISKSEGSEGKGKLTVTNYNAKIKGDIEQLKSSDAKLASNIKINNNESTRPRSSSSTSSDYKWRIPHSKLQSNSNANDIKTQNTRRDHATKEGQIVNSRVTSKISRRTSLPSSLTSMSISKSTVLRQSKTDPAPNTHFSRDQTTTASAKLSTDAVGDTAHPSGHQKPQHVSSTSSRPRNTGRRSLDSAISSLPKPPPLSSTSANMHRSKTGRPVSMYNREYELSETTRSSSAREDSRLTSSPLLEMLYCHLDTVRSVDLRLDDHGNTQMLTGSEDGIVTLWDVNKTRKLVTKFNQEKSTLPHKKLRGHVAAVTSVVFVDGHPSAYSAGMDVGIQVWSLEPTPRSGLRLESGFPERTLTAHTDATWDLALCGDQKWLASASADGTCAIWDLESKKSRPVSSLEYSNSNNDKNGNPIDIKDHIPTSLCFMPNKSSNLAVAFTSGDAQLFDLETQKTVLAWVPKPQDLGPLSPINKIITSKTGMSVMFAGTDDGQVLLLDSRTSKVQNSWHPSRQAVTALDVDTERKLIATGGPDSTLRWWDLRASRCYAQDPAYATKGGEGICSIRFGPQQATKSVERSSSQLLTATGAADGIVRLYMDDHLG